MNKSQYAFGLRSMVALVAVFSFVFLFAGGVHAASTIGTNMSTTGTLTVTPATDSATSVRFQNAAGTNFFIADSTNSRIGVGGAPQTVFEVQGTASASYLMTANSLQVAGVASVAYSRFGTGATGHSLAATDDVLFTGLVEFDDNAFFDARLGVNGAPSTLFEVQGTASASYLMTANSLQVAGVASVAYSRFGTGTTGNTGEFNAANDLLITGSLEIDGKASLASNFQMSGKFFADTAASHSFTGDLSVTSNLVVGPASSSTDTFYVAEFSTSTVGTASYLFAGGGNSASTTGTCFQLKSTDGTWIYMRFNTGASTPTLSIIKCR